MGNKELITIALDDLDGWVNDLTKELDTYLKFKDIDWQTYIFEHPVGLEHILRYPGSSIGKIVTDINNVILEIILYEGCFYEYLETAKDCLAKYIGMTLVYKE